MSVELHKKSELILPGIIITAGFWMVILVEALFGLGPLYPHWLPRWFLVAVISVCVGSSWVLLYKISLYPEFENNP